MWRGDITLTSLVRVFLFSLFAFPGRVVLSGALVFRRGLRPAVADKPAVTSNASTLDGVAALSAESRVMIARVWRGVCSLSFGGFLGLLDYDCISSRSF